MWLCVVVCVCGGGGGRSCHDSESVSQSEIRGCGRAIHLPTEPLKSRFVWVPRCEPGIRQQGWLFTFFPVGWKARLVYQNSKHSWRGQPVRLNLDITVDNIDGRDSERPYINSQSPGRRHQRDK